MKAEYEWSRFNCPPLDGMIADDLIYRMAVEHLQSELHCAQFQKRKKNKKKNETNQNKKSNESPDVGERVEGQ